MKPLHKNKGLGFWQSDRADGDNSLQLSRVYVLNTRQETEHTLRGDTANRRIEPSPLTKRLSPLCLSICVYCIKPFLCCCLMASALTGSVYLSFCLSPLVWQPVCLWASVHLAPRGPLAVPFTPSGRPLSCLPKCPPPPPPWCTWTLEGLLWSKGFLINLRYLTCLDQRPTQG